jgi:hypothetical protein
VEVQEFFDDVFGFLTSVGVFIRQVITELVEGLVRLLDLFG